MAMKKSTFLTPFAAAGFPAVENTSIALKSNSRNSVAYCGATPVFADVNPNTWTLDPADVKRKITSKTKAIMPVHIYGHPAEMDSLLDLAKQHHMFVIEDA